jgi:hypothetical protein
VYGINSSFVDGFGGWHKFASFYFRHHLLESNFRNKREESLLLELAGYTLAFWVFRATEFPYDFKSISGGQRRNIECTLDRINRFSFILYHYNFKFFSD